jgi:ABC-type dipeptide/oligopeptide/nickel transport system permease component
MRSAIRILLRLLATIPLVVLVVVGLFRLAPGARGLDLHSDSPASAAGNGAAEARFAADHLLDASFARQYFHALGPFDLSPSGHRWFGGDHSRPWHGLLAFEFGREQARPQVRVADELGRRLLLTVPLAGAALALALLLALPLGHWLVLRGGRADGRLLGFVLLCVDALPGFALCLLLVQGFGPAGLDLLPAQGIASREPTLPPSLDRAWHLVLPVLALTLGSIAHLARQFAAGLAAVEGEEWMRAARANGLSRSQALRRHGWRHAAGAMVGLLGGALPGLISGSVVVETIFGLQGLGGYAMEAVLARDHGIVLHACTLAAVLAVVGSVASDLLLARLDPRVVHG